MSQQPSILRHPALRLFLLVAVVGTPLAAQAYVGPGAGLSLLSALWGLLCAVGAALLFVILWPLRRMRRRRAERNRAHESTATSETHDSATGTPNPSEPSTARADDEQSPR
ncbi:hypothetical protein [Salinisphaera sp. Q1T1-3]|uniref:hypothetical protein n=1 Tax=Salinisphaera sp. Q1T1-3 TaxID=2321229 RepID=UPI0018F2AB42|nr:hypothetical protein [Salinisphaera sp. Q1T1-3]